MFVNPWQSSGHITTMSIRRSYSRALRKRTCVPDTEYAATAMSELLGWYGYEKVDSGCTRGLNLDHFAPVTSSKHPLPQMDRHFIFKGTSTRSAMAANQSAFSHSLRTKLTPSYYPTEILKNTDKASTTSSLPLKTSTSQLPYHNDSTSSSPGKISANHPRQKISLKKMKTLSRG